MLTKRIPYSVLLTGFVLVGSLWGVLSCTPFDHPVPNPMTLTAVPGPPFATGLKAPIGLADDAQGNLWVTEAGTGKASDGQVTLITPAGVKYPVITGFVSGLSPENSPEGVNHLLLKDGKLYVLHGVEDKLYIVDVAGFVPGVTAPIAASSLTGIDIGTFVRNAHPNAPDPKDSNPYALVFGPGGDLFIADAGGNAIIRRNQTTGALSIYAVFPDFPNPTYPGPPAPVGPPTIDAVPNGIVFDGTDFFVTALSGFPFPPGSARIFKVSGTGAAPVTPAEYKTGFSGLTDLILTPGGQLLVTEFGFTPPGRVAKGSDPAVTLFAPAITPVDIHRSSTSPNTYYVLSYGPGIIVKLTAN
jgi:hypothetical protein